MELTEKNQSGILYNENNTESCDSTDTLINGLQLVLFCEGGGYFSHLF